MSSDLKQQIDEETNLIRTLENSYPEYVSKAGRYSPENRAFELHHTNVRDAYWRRRMLIAELENLSIQSALKCY